MEDIQNFIILNNPGKNMDQNVIYWKHWLIKLEFYSMNTGHE